MVTSNQNFSFDGHLWDRAEVCSCNCPEKPYRHVHCKCFSCQGRATSGTAEWARCEFLQQNPFSWSWRVRVRMSTRLQTPHIDLHRNTAFMVEEIFSSHSIIVNILLFFFVILRALLARTPQVKAAGDLRGECGSAPTSCCFILWIVKLWSVWEKNLKHVNKIFLISIYRMVFCKQILTLNTEEKSFQWPVAMIRSLATLARATQQMFAHAQGSRRIVEWFGKKPRSNLSPGPCSSLFSKWRILKLDSRVKPCL